MAAGRIEKWVVKGGNRQKWRKLDKQAGMLKLMPEGWLREGQENRQ
jgi:hypothetical protein